MAKIANKIIKKSPKGSPYYGSYDNYVCVGFIQLLLNKSPERIRVRVYTKNPKRKNSVHVKVAYNYHPFYTFTIRGKKDGDFGLDGIDRLLFDNENPKEFWVVVTEIS